MRPDENKSYRKLQDSKKIRNDFSTCRGITTQKRENLASDIA
jgi:hypothetical protein